MALASATTSPKAAALTFALALAVASVRACLLPTGGCKACSKGLVAYEYGVLLNKLGSFNLEYFLPEDEECKTTTVLGYYQEVDKEHCCSKCASTTNCVYWHYYDPAIYKQTPPKSGYNCYLLDKDHEPTKGVAKYGSWVGGMCNPKSTMVNDPHLEGARGTRYDFNGDLDKSFCLVSDKDIHVNMLLGGYYDNRTTGATVLKNGKALRTWAREVGVVFKAGGAEHKLRLVARRGRQQDRATGFLAKAELDGKSLPLPKVGASLALGGRAKLNFVAYEKSGPYDVDFYTLTISGLAIMEIRMRIASKILQSPSDAEVHFNLAFAELRTTPLVHGVLGQTYRNDRERVERALKYSAQVELLGHAIAADGESGAGFLDGRTHDYISSSVTAADCKFATYGGALAHTDAVIQMPTEV